MKNTNNSDIPLYMYHANQCDPKKCSGKKLARFGLATIVDRRLKIPSGILFLDPFAKQAVSPKDDVGRGIFVLDCSWEEVEWVFPKLSRFNLEHRALPFLLASNPVNFGKPFKLCTAEAFAAALYITGRKEQAHVLLNKFKWGHTFIELNFEPLEEYSKAKDSSDVVRIQMEYIGDINQINPDQE